MTREPCAGDDEGTVGRSHPSHLLAAATPGAGARHHLLDPRLSPPSAGAFHPRHDRAHAAAAAGGGAGGQRGD